MVVSFISKDTYISCQYLSGNIISRVMTAIKYYQSSSSSKVSGTGRWSFSFRFVVIEL